MACLTAMFPPYHDRVIAMHQDDEDHSWDDFDIVFGRKPPEPQRKFRSKHTFQQTDLVARLERVPWFEHCGRPVMLDLSVPARQVGSWAQAARWRKCRDSQNASIESQNHLTIWLDRHHHRLYQGWNDVVDDYEARVITPLQNAVWVPFQERLGLPDAVVHGVLWDVLGALMENHYLHLGHTVVYRLELLSVYEAGHFPCGWVGKWPDGELRFY